MLKDLNKIDRSMMMPIARQNKLKKQRKSPNKL